MLKADFPYIHYDHVPKWYNYEGPDRFNYGLICATLPSIYVLRESWNSVLQITFIRSMIENYEFDTEIVNATSVSLRR